MDYLVELGRQSANTNVEVGARLGAVDDVFAGTANKNFNLGAESDIASGKLRYQDMPRTYNNLVGDFHVPRAFQDRVALHLANRFMSDASNPASAARARARSARASKAPSSSASGAERAVARHLTSS